jgi:outer membrane protein assembly factor BamB
LKVQRIVLVLLLAALFTAVFSSTAFALTEFQQGAGYQPGAYDRNAAQPTAFNWTRQSRFNGPQKPSLKWTFQTGNAIQKGVISSSVVIGTDGTVYVTSGNANLLYAINPNGTRKWGFPAGSVDGSSPPAIGSDGSIYFNATQGGLYALKPDGSQKWRFGDLMSNSQSEPIIGNNGTVYNVAEELTIFKTFLYAINSTNGSLLWKTALDEDWPFPTPAIAKDGTIYVASDKLYAIKTDGSIKWVSSIGGATNSSPTIASDGTIYVGSLDNNVYAFKPDGSMKWKFTTGDFVNSSPAIATDGTVYIGSLDKNLYALNPDGSKKWMFSTGGAVRSSPIISMNGIVYVGSYDGKVYAINPDGSPKWMAQTDHWIASPPAIGSDGTLYVSSMGGVVYAIVDSDVSGDINDDGLTNILDLILINQLRGPSTDNNIRADFNNDGVIDIKDLLIVAQHLK